jgi:hypothetical protein
LAQVVPATALKIVTETMAVHRDLIPGRSPGRPAAAVEALLPAGIVVIGQWDLRVAPVVVRLKTTERLEVEPSSKAITAGPSRYGETGVVTRPEVTDLRRVPVVVVRGVPEKTRDAGAEVALEETVSALA